MDTGKINQGYSQGPPMNPQYPGDHQYPPPAYPMQPAAGYYPQAYSPPPSSQQQQQSSVVVVQQPQTPAVVVRTAPYDYLGSAIAVTIFCFFPLGIAAIISAVNSQTYARQQDMDEAYKWSYRARLLVIASIVCGCIWIIILIAVLASASASVHSY